MDTLQYTEVADRFTGNTWPSPGNPAIVAQVMLAKMQPRYVVTHQNTMYGWNGSEYAKIKDPYLDRMLTDALIDARYMKTTKDGQVPEPWSPDQRKKKLVIHEMKTLTLIDDSVSQGDYIGDAMSRGLATQANLGSDLGVLDSESSVSNLLTITREKEVVPTVYSYIGKKRLTTTHGGSNKPLTSEYGVSRLDGSNESADSAPYSGYAFMADTGSRRLDWYAWPSSPDYFFTYHVDAQLLDDGDPEGWVYELPCPTWHAFLKSIWPDEPESVDLLQEIFGYLLSSRTDLQKAFMIVGKRRSGKGTISRILTALLGEQNVASPTLRGLVDDAVKASLIGKTLATVNDAGNAGRAAADLAEVIKTISGEDRVVINRKYMDAWEGKLSTRFLLLSNAVPKFNDESGAIASRFAILHTAISYEGQEDIHLLAKLLNELAGILTWALEGLDRLNANGGHFTEPASAKTTKAALRSMSNPKLLFGAEYIIRAEAGEVAASEIFDSWRKWCAMHNERPGSAASFGSWLAEEYGVQTYRPRVNGKQVRMYFGVTLSDDAPRPSIDISQTSWQS